MASLVICCFRPKEGKEAELDQVIADHLPILRSQGLITDRPGIAMRASDGTVVEVFEWLSDDAIRAAHSNPVVLALWKRYEEASTMLPYGDLPEAKEFFPAFSALS